jgi:hypothetical protein
MKSRIVGLLLALALGLAVVIAGCGSTTSVHQNRPQSKPSATAKATPTATPSPHTVKPSGLTLAEASSHNYQVQFPVVPSNTLGQLGNAWENSGLLAGSPVAECPPANFLTKWVPTVVPVKNEDPAITQAQADAYGRALMVTFTWTTWASYADTPAVLQTVGQATGPDAPYLQMILSGFRGVGTLPGSATYPDSITLIPLTGNESSQMADSGAKFALVVQYPKVGYSFQSQYPGKPVTTAHASPSPPGIYDGSVVSSPELGTYFKVASFATNCATGPVAGICESAGAY